MKNQLMQPDSEQISNVHLSSMASSARHVAQILDARPCTISNLQDAAVVADDLASTIKDWLAFMGRPVRG